ncbi:MAG TPA: hypothetical protein VNG71_12230 [Pyrinomonadaceae bacterium]|nr:hypothetical protein [Pyrinomonadaceae bacterium]
MIEKKKTDFLIYQAVATSIISAFQHAGVYKKGIEVGDTRKIALRNDLEGALRSAAIRYTNPINEEEHCRNIEDLANALTKTYKPTGILRSDRFRIGIAQKALNLYLKNLWCLGEITTPPHCPLDRIIIDKLGLKRSERSQYDWTKLDDIESYKKLIRLCHHKSRERGCENIAEWELEVYKESNASNAIPGIE